MLDFLFGEKVVKTTTIKEKTIQTSKRMYSEDEVLDIFFLGRNTLDKALITKDEALILIKQFKNK